MKGMGGGGGMQQIMKQANQMERRMKKIQEELASREFEGRAGGGAVSVRVNIDHMIQAIEIQPDVFKSGDAEMLQDMVMASANEAIKSAKETYDTEMNKVTGGFSIPGMF